MCFLRSFAKTFRRIRPCWLFGLSAPPLLRTARPQGSYLVGFFFPATVTFFPLRVRALQRVFCPAHPNVQPPRQQPGARRARAVRARRPAYSWRGFPQSRSPRAHRSAAPGQNGTRREGSAPLTGSPMRWRFPR